MGVNDMAVSGAKRAMDKAIDRIMHKKYFTGFDKKGNYHHPSGLILTPNQVGFVEAVNRRNDAAMVSLMNRGAWFRNFIKNVRADFAPSTKALTVVPERAVSALSTGATKTVETIRKKAGV